MNKFYLKTLLLCLFSLLGINASAYDCVVNGIYYNLDNGYHVAYVTYKNYNSLLNKDAYKGTVNIPSSFYYNGVWYDVHVIESYAFYGCSEVTSVTIPDGVVNIMDYAFSKCSNLSSITMPNSLSRIGKYAFEGCNGLTSITIPKSVYSIGKCPLVNCSNLESIIVEEGNKYYDTSEGCNAIISIDDGTLIAGCKNTNIPNNVKNIGEGAFQGCTGLTSINIPNGVRHIWDNAFSGCTGLISVTNPSIIDGIFGDYNYFGYGAFANCSSLTSINIPSNVDYIPQFTFRYCI